MAESRPRLALFGPVLPYRGGIAQHTTMLLRALRDLADVEAFSFSRQYPRLIFPGESDRDPAFEGHEEPGVRYVVDSVNPLTWRSAARRAACSRPAAAFMPWWTFFWAPCFGYIAGFLRRRGIPVVFLSHNVVDHESAGWKASLARGVLRHGGAHVVHTASDEVKLKALLGDDVLVARRAHPMYAQFPPSRGTLPRRAALELLFFGFVRLYKGLDVLVEAMGLLRDEDVRLTIAGEFWAGSEATQMRLGELGVAEKVEVLDGYLAEDQVAELFGRADAVVLPYRSGTGSGVIGLAYSYGKPVVVTRVGGLPDVVSDGETGFVVEPESPEALADAMRRLAGGRAATMLPAIEEYRATLTWESLAETVLEMAAAAARKGR